MIFLAFGIHGPLKERIEPQTLSDVKTDTNKNHVMWLSITHDINQEVVL